MARRRAPRCWLAEESAALTASASSSNVVGAKLSAVVVDAPHRLEVGEGPAQAHSAMSRSVQDEKRARVI